mgnify:FL=1
MFFWFNGVTVYLGFDLNKYHETIAFLKENGVKFKMRMHNMNPRGRGHTGVLRPEFSFKYEVRVSKQDAERLGYLRRKD